MVKQVYSIEDVKLNVFLPPMVLINDMAARRLFSDVANDSQTDVGRHPEDFRLVRLGDFNDNSGLLSPLATPEFLCNAVEFVNKNS